MTTTDILIIGEGIAGASTAYHLALLGHRVTLVEHGAIASEASGVNAGAIGWERVPDLGVSHYYADVQDIILTPHGSRAPRDQRV